MGARTRGLDIAINAKRQVVDAAARAEAKGVVERWNEQLAASRYMLWSPTIRAALIAGTPWLDVFCPAAARAGRLIRRHSRRPWLAPWAISRRRASWPAKSGPAGRRLATHEPASRLASPAVPE
jgi:hypothetical protein